MNNTLITTILLFIFCNNIYTQNKNFNVPKLSDKAQVSLLTIGVGEETYQLFGHTAIRIKDEQLGWDLVYNYGTFDFSDPDFLEKFIKGKLLYYLSVDNYQSFINDYKEQNRSIQEQLLDLDTAQIQKIFDFLTTNAREEYKYYKYDFLFDNCATRPRDVIDKVIFKSKISYQPDVDDAATYRELIDRHNTNEWLDFGMDLLIGLPTDKKAGYGRTFLPYELMQLFEGATINGKPLVLHSQEILSAVPAYKSRQWLTPGLVFWLLFAAILILQIKGWFNNIYFYKIFSVIYFTVLGLLGWLLVFMWLGTEHSTTKWNLNILWTMPLNFPLAISLLFKTPKTWIRKYFSAYRIILILLLGAWAINPQQFHAATIPLILLAILLVSKHSVQSKL
jgi:hypothetical protein